MEEFVNFIKEYGVYILAAISAVLSFVCILVKNKPKTLKDFVYCLEATLAEVPQFVYAAEVQFGSGHGSEKYSRAMSLGLTYLTKALGRELDEQERSRAIFNLDSSIEAVLACPQKKGGK